MTAAELRLVAELSTAFHFRAAAPQAQAWLSAGFFALTGVPDPPSIGWHWTDAIHADDRASFRDRWRRADADGARLDIEVRLEGAAGAGQRYRIRAAPLERAADGGGAPGWVGVAQGAREGMGTTAELTGEFLATASHELRTPLNAIAGWLHVLKLHLQDDLQQAHALAAIERNVRVEKALIESLLDVSELARGTVTIVPTRIDLAAVVRTAVSNASPAATAKSLGLHLAAPAAPVFVTVDRPKIEQVVWHLLANAIRSTSPPGDVHVEVRRDGAHACLRVRDTGEGIDVNFLPYVFEPFSQRPRIAARAGLGLGLTVVRALVELHGGSVSAASEGHGHGAVFDVTLPSAA